MSKVEVSEIAAVYNVGEDTIAFCLEPETLSAFWAWMDQRGKLAPDYTPDLMKQDMQTVLAAIRRRPRVKVRGHG
jgi:hypothetical protein